MQNIYNEAIGLANLCLENDEVPVGAVIFESESKKIIATGRNAMIELSDPTAHAEIIAIREASLSLGVTQLNGFSIFTTLEPCPMCMFALSLSRIDNVYFGAYDEKRGAAGGCFNLQSQPACCHKCNIYGGIMEEKCGQIIKEFFAKKRSSQQ